jgi:hypothetical protein
MVYFHTKIPVGLYFGGPWKGTCWFIFKPFGIFFGPLEYFSALWYILGTFGNFEDL